MKINRTIVEYLSAVKVGEIYGVPYLLALYFGYDPIYVPKDLKELVASSGIYRRDGSTIVWLVPLFEGQEVAFDWVETEYLKLFEPIGKNKHKRECISRMKSLFRTHPDIRKEDVLSATRLYLSNTDPRFVRMPHYFISKGVGADKVQDILEWIDKYRQRQERILEDRDDSRRLL